MIQCSKATEICGCLAVIVAFIGSIRHTQEVLCVSGTVIMTKQALHLLDWAHIQLPPNKTTTTQTPAERQALCNQHQQQSMRLQTMKQDVAQSEASDIICDACCPALSTMILQLC